jgi:hypothetical protein
VAFAESFLSAKPSTSGKGPSPRGSPLSAKTLNIVVIYDCNFCRHMLVTFHRIRAFYEVVIRVQHINAIVHEVEAIHKDLVQKTRVQKTK